MPIQQSSEYLSKGNQEEKRIRENNFLQWRSYNPILASFVQNSSISIESLLFPTFQSSKLTIQQNEEYILENNQFPLDLSNKFLRLQSASSYTNIFNGLSTVDKHNLYWMKRINCTLVYVNNSFCKMVRKLLQFFFC